MQESKPTNQGKLALSGLWRIWNCGEYPSGEWLFGAPNGDIAPRIIVASQPVVYIRPFAKNLRHDLRYLCDNPHYTLLSHFVNSPYSIGCASLLGQIPWKPQEVTRSGIFWPPGRFSGRFERVPKPSREAKREVRPQTEGSRGISMPKPLCHRKQRFLDFLRLRPSSSGSTGSPHCSGQSSGQAATLARNDASRWAWVVTFWRF